MSSVRYDFRLHRGRSNSKQKVDFISKTYLRMSSSPIGAYDLTDEEQTKAYLNELEKTYSFECFSEKKPIGKFLSEVQFCSVS